MKRTPFCIKTRWPWVALVGVTTLVMGCTATQTAVHKRKLDVQTRMSSTLFLDPINSHQRTIFVQLRNTPDKESLDLAPCLLASLKEKGYQILSSPEQAQYLLQINVMRVGKADLSVVEQALNAGFGAAAPGMIADARTENPLYCTVADVQISERVGSSMTVKEKTKIKLKEGSVGHQDITSTEKITWKRYQTRIISTAAKTNLKFKQAAPPLVEGLSHAISGIF